MVYLLSEFTLSQLQVILKGLQVLVILQYLHETVIWIAEFHIFCKAII